MDDRYVGTRRKLCGVSFGPLHMDQGQVASLAHQRHFFFLMRHLISAQIRLVETLHHKTPIQIVNVLSFNKDKGTI